MANHDQVTRAPRRPRAGVLAGLLLSGVAVPLVWLSAAPVEAATLAAEQSRTVRVGDVAEAWYADSPLDLCTTPLGCPPDTVPSSPYPEDTLHVGVAGGQETARTYVVPDLAKVPYGSVVTAATMTLPVATGDQDGTQAPETAKLVACLTTEAVTDGAQGTGGAPPKVDCKTSAKAEYDAKQAVFTVDLSAFTKAWADGAPSFGIALVPAPAVQPTDAWHVAFNGRERKHTDHVMSVLTFNPPAPIEITGSAPTGGSGSTGVDSATAAPPGSDVSLPGSGTTDASGGQAPPDVAEQPPVVAQPQQQPVALSRAFQYPMAFLMPLALLAGAVFFTRLFTRDATPRFTSR